MPLVKKKRKRSGKKRTKPSRDARREAAARHVIGNRIGCKFLNGPLTEEMIDALKVCIEQKFLLCNQIKQPEGTWLVKGPKTCENRHLSMKTLLGDRPFVFFAHVTNKAPGLKDKCTHMHTNTHTKTNIQCFTQTRTRINRWQSQGSCWQTELTRFEAPQVKELC